ncbi:MAG: proton-conducting membrane transporter [Firmicutes bacterium]|nr:proton-conducting membrane transporter [Bacillota bacterium]
MASGLLVIALFLPLFTGLTAGDMRKAGRTFRRYIVWLLSFEVLAVLALVIGGQGTVLPLLKVAGGLQLVLRVDAMGSLFAVVFSIIWLLVAVFGFEYMAHEGKSQRFYLFYICTLSALIGVCFAANMATLYMFFEMMALLTVPLIIHSGTEDSYMATLKYLGYSIFGAGLGLLGIFFLAPYGGIGSFVAGGNLDPALLAGHEELALAMYFVAIIGFGCKAGLLPLHAWLPTAHPVAPSPASAVLSGIITKAGVLAILRMTYFVFPAELLRGSWVQAALLILAICTVFTGSMLAYKEKLLKRRLAYSTVSQVSYVLFGIFLLHPVALLGALLQFIYHALAKNILFLSAGAIIMKTHHTTVDKFSGLGRRMPLMMGAFTVASLSLVGIPPCGGFVSKWYLCVGALDSATPLIGMVGMVVLMVSALLTAGYLLPLVIAAFFPGRDVEVKRDLLPESMSVPLVILALLVVCLGLGAGWLAQPLNAIVATLFA